MRSVGAALWIGVALLAATASFAPSAHAGDVTVRDDPFLPFREYIVILPLTATGMNRAQVDLAARVDRETQTITTLIKVDIAYIAEHRRIYESARNARAEALRFTAITHTKSCEKRDSCVYDDRFTVAIPLSDLSAAPAAGYPVKVFSRGGGDITIPVSKSQIDRVLAAARVPPPAPAH